MSKRDSKIVLEDIQESIEKIETYTLNFDFDSFVQNGMVIDAVVRNLEIIGEAANQIPDEIKVKFQNIPWRKIIGLRNRIIHEYFGVDISIIWYIIKNELPTLKTSIEKIISIEL